MNIKDTEKNVNYTNVLFISSIVLFLNAAVTFENPRCMTV